MNSAEEIERILAAESYAVVGASRSREKYGSLVYRSLKAAGKTVYAVNPLAEEIDGDPCYHTLSDLPKGPDAAVMIVPPAITERIVRTCASLGINQVWMQPGAESELAVRLCHEKQITVVAGGPCIMVMLRTHDPHQ